MNELPKATENNPREFVSVKQPESIGAPNMMDWMLLVICGMILMWSMAKLAGL